MQSITKVMRTETGHRLTNYNGKCAHLHGHSYRWEVTVCGENENNGMVMDFKDLKKIMAKVIGKLDHALILHDQDKLVASLGSHKLMELLETPKDIEPRLFIVYFNPTVENLVLWVARDIKKELKWVGIDLYSIKCWETADSFCTIFEGQV